MYSKMIEDRVVNAVRSTELSLNKAVKVVLSPAKTQQKGAIH